MKKGEMVVSLNPEFGIEIEALVTVANSVRISRPELYSILTIVISVIIANDDKGLLKYCNNYITDKLHGDEFYGDLKSALGYYIDLSDSDKKKPHDPWYPPFEDDEL